MVEALNRPIVYLDSMVFIYALENKDATGEPARNLFGHLRPHRGVALTSELALAEVFAPTKARGKIPDRLKRAYLELMSWSGVVRLEPISRSILVETADVRVFTKLKLPDAIHLTTAIRTGCIIFMTRDADINVPAGITRVLPDRAGVGEVLRTLA